MMIDAKTQEVQPPMASVPPPEYSITQPSLSQPAPSQPEPQARLQLPAQPQWQSPAQFQQRSTPHPQTGLAAAAELGEQYRAAQFAKCAQGEHNRETKYGICGIITAVVCFPIGLICLCMDKEEVCTRCGNKL
ncbi:hypothetical protein E4T56_gene5196 [Termitomyces sp. T112]|nr:hypothetical protein E4T56_gene5196 [Termitomyces sp. T112]KAH0579220.1 hypothetical protein H2248_003370 [Termitomyces sp. 'cryptogamus']